MAYQGALCTCSAEQQAAKARRPGPGAWLSFEAASDAPQPLAWQHQVYLFKK